MTIIAPSVGGKLSTGLAATAAASFAVFRKVDLPDDINLDGLMNWLGKRMNDSDADIRTKMSSINDRKAQQDGLTELITALRNSKRNPDEGDGGLKLDAPLDDLTALKGSPLYTNLDSDMRDKFDKFLEQITIPNVMVTSPPPVMMTLKGKLMTKDEAASWGLTDANVKEMPTRLHKDFFDNAIETLGDMSKNLGSRDEMEMIKLQSAIAARGQLLQMVSNMIASFNQTAEKIVGNTR